MQIAIDAYCYHRFFGEWYEGLQTDPGRRMTTWEFLDRAQALGAAGVSLESCFVAFDQAGLLPRLRAELDRRGLERVWAWGHPHGLRSGTDAAAAADLDRHIGIAAELGARVMRICAGGRRTRIDDWPTHKAGLVALLQPLLREAARRQVVLAIENHIDLYAHELLDLLQTMDSPWLGVCLDTANNLRLLEHPLEVARQLAPWVRATHVKDVAALRGAPRSFAFWPSVPLGEGCVELPAILALLQAHGYGGLLAIEIDYLHPAWPDEDAALALSVQRLRGWLRETGATGP